MGGGCSAQPKLFEVKDDPATGVLNIKKALVVDGFGNLFYEGQEAKPPFYAFLWFYLALLSYGD